MRSWFLLLALLTGAADAGSLPTIDDNSGSFTYSVPIDLPPGPGGSSPELALLYSSAAGSGNAGYGWSLPYSSVSLDTRDGHPQFWLPHGDAEFCDPAVMGGRILLDGMELVPSPDDPWVAEVGANLGERCVFRSRPDTFLLAVPIFDDACAAEATGPTGWAVVRQNGTVWWYGDPRCDEDAWHLHSSIANGPGSQADLPTRWLLHHVEDREGNLVTWWPDRWSDGWADAAEPLAGCDGCLRFVTWAEDAKEGMNQSGRAFDPVLLPNSSEWSYPPMQLGSAATNFRGLLEAPAQAFPQPRPHRLFAQIDWEARPDVRTSWRSGRQAVQDRRIAQISVAAWAHPARSGSGRMELPPTASPTRIRTYRLDYDAGSTGRSLLTRVWNLPNEYRNNLLYGYFGIPDRDEAWDPQSRQDLLAQHPSLSQIPNPWEFVYSRDDVLDPDSPDLHRQVPALDSVEDRMQVNSTETNPWARRAWLGSHWAEGGFATRQLMDLNGDGLPDLVQHDLDLPAYSNVLDNLTQIANPWLDLMPTVDCGGQCADPSSASDRFWVHWNQGDAFSQAQPGPYDPIAVQQVVDFMPMSIEQLVDSFEPVVFTAARSGIPVRASEPSRSGAGVAPPFPHGVRAC
jgi:hypothetical protein